MTKKSYFLIEMALEKIYSLVKSKNTLSESINMASKEYHLSEEEKDEINKILNKAEESDHEDDFDVKTQIIQQPEYIIYFDSEEDLSNSIGRLMYNKVPWVEQITDNKFGIKFKNEEDTNKAIKVLKDYEFVSNSDMFVANITFDDIENYKKVVDFITKNGMYFDVNPKENIQTSVESKPTEFDAKTNQTKELDFNDAYQHSIFVKKSWS